MPTDPAHYELIKNNLDQDHRIDIRDIESVSSIIDNIKPNYIFHLAAQPIVLDSYQNPLETFKINTIGTANILDVFTEWSAARAPIILSAKPNSSVPLS